MGWNNPDYIPFAPLGLWKNTYQHQRCGRVEGVYIEHESPENPTRSGTKGMRIKKQIVEETQSRMNVLRRVRNLTECGTKKSQSNRMSIIGEGIEG